jgi:PleD family two-component response regulator
MILAALDDLMFTSRITTAAAAAGAELRLARTADAVLDAARQLGPSVILMDLNCRAVDPLATLSRLKSDPALAAIRVVGFASHVQADVIAAARAAGADDVLARSAFVARLPQLLAAGPQ